MLFFYKAKSKEGEIFDGSMESVDRFSVAHELILQGAIPLSVSTKTTAKADMSFSISKMLGRIKVTEKIIFTRNLSGMLNAGLPLSRALSVLEKQTTNDAFRPILVSLRAEVDKGEALSSALAKYPKVFSHLFVSMIKAGEESGNLSGSLTEIGVNLEKANAITKKVKGALMYPGVILCVMVLIGVLMMIFVVPTLSKTFADLGTALPASTQFILGLAGLFSGHPVLTFLALGLIGFGIVVLLKAKFMQPILDKVVVHLPMIGVLAKELNTARTTRTLSSLITSGVPITRAIEITQDVVQNMYYQRVLGEAKIAVEKGAPFSESFKRHTELYPVMVGEMMEVGEETGKLSDMLLQIALFYEEEVENKTKNLSTIVEPLLMVFIGGAVGFFAISMITPMYSVMDNIH